MGIVQAKTMSPKLSEQFSKINRIFEDTYSVLLVSHENPDADAVGSLLAAKFFLEALGKECTMYLPTEPSKKFSFLRGLNEIVTSLDGGIFFDAVLALDYGDFTRLGLPGNIQFRYFISIDHHPYASQRGDVKLIAPEFSSTSEIVCWWLQWSEFSLDADAANCLLAGIIADSGIFTHASTSATTLKAAAHLISRGASLEIVLSNLRTMCDPGGLQLMGKILFGTRIDERTGLAYSGIVFDDLAGRKADELYLEDVPTFISSASKRNLGLFLSEERPGLIRGSLRADPSSEVDVSSVAKALGGGGHKYAAGFKHQGSIEEALKKVLNLLE